MKKTIQILSLLCFICTLNVHSQTQQEKGTRTKKSINFGWKFHLGDPDGALYTEKLDDSKWESVNVPHSLELTSMDLNGNQDDKYQKTFMRNVGWYRRDIAVTADTSKKVFLEFEGVHQVTNVWVNGKHVGEYAVGGYTPFHFDISKYVTYGGKNQVTVKADNRKSDIIPPDPGPMDYIKFGGLYRDVYLVETNPTHVTFNWESDISGQNITTPTVDPINLNGTVNIKTGVRNETNQTQKTTVVNRLVDKNGLVVLKLSQTKEIGAGNEVQFNEIGSIEDDFHLWSTDNPYLYRVNTTVFENGKLVDETECKMGFRKIEMNNMQGVLLNGKPIKLIGVNRHQHYGFIGDAMPNSLHYKDALQIKKLGMNVIRTAHYPHDNAFIEACDELGILIYEEAPTWMSIGSNEWFDNYEKAARTMVRNHRNHPSVFIWGAGINHRGYVPRAHNIMKQEDPTRFTASQSSRWTGWQNSGLTDIFAQMIYGDYYWSGDEPILAMEGKRGPEAVNDFMSSPMKIGHIAWTAHAYYTFHPNPDKRDKSRSGMMTVFRYPRPGLFWYQSELTKVPFTRLETDWKEGTQEVIVYSNADQVELVLNGKIIATQSPTIKDDYKNLKHAPFHFKIENFEKGTLTANGLVEGQKMSSDTKMTPEAPDHIILELDSEGRKLTADGSDIIVGYAKVVDKNGTILQEVDMDISFSVKGNATIVGDQTAAHSNPMFTTHGVAPVLIQAGTAVGKIEVTAFAKGLKSGKASIMSTKVDDNAFEPETIHDLEQIKVDLGGNDQLVQFDWTPWNGNDNNAGIKTFSEMGGFTAKIEAIGKVENTRWLGEINVIGKYGFACGDGVLGATKEGLSLELTGLKKGKYQLKTVHHAPRTNTDSMDPNQEKAATYKIYQIPYAKKINISTTDKNGTTVKENSVVTEGSDMQNKSFGNSTQYFESDGINPVKIIFKDPKGAAVWLNNFELSQWY
ncbi:glycoside hydrolase family 2 [Flavobacterium faecale]|uniref:Glycoside hydrolase family 2 n=1 Tax=Flavobacterium faecale TaxID=1355330 RepID=A0A2S1LG31_9FLAO|nr:glycoside hydrolase family 2 TIM barrel-domain containing protein [Flavobacterium faecale]AWG22715.1 glycoside hydrolase family 2 [Flavobacterium faecale]